MLNKADGICHSLDEYKKQSEADPRGDDNSMAGLKYSTAELKKVCVCVCMCIYV